VCSAQFCARPIVLIRRSQCAVSESGFACTDLVRDRDRCGAETYQISHPELANHSHTSRYQRMAWALPYHILQCLRQRSVSLYVNHFLRVCFHPCFDTARQHIRIHRHPLFFQSVLIPCCASWSPPIRARTMKDNMGRTGVSSLPALHSLLQQRHTRGQGLIKRLSGEIDRSRDHTCERWLIVSERRPELLTSMSARRTSTTTTFAFACRSPCRSCTAI